jgi:hypothetical protein
MKALGAVLLLATAACAQVDLSGVWVVSGSPDIPGELPYNAEAMKIWQERKANLRDQDPATYCLPNGVVRVTTRPYKIVQTQKLVVILSEGNTHSFRRLFLDGRGHQHVEDVEPDSWTGHSIAKWEGDTLVVDTIGFNGRAWLDSTGKPLSAAARVTERYRRPSAARLEVEYTLEDSKFLTKPFKFTRVFALAPGREIEEQFCTDLNHLIPEKR